MNKSIDIDQARQKPKSIVPDQIGTPRQFVWLRRIVLMVVVLNALDAMLTLIWVWQERAIEANPLMANLVHNNPLLFVIVKMALVVLGTIFLWRRRGNKFAVVSIFMVFLVYYWILLYHLHSMNIGLVQQLFD